MKVVDRASGGFTKFLLKRVARALQEIQIQDERVK
jgi:hypothetical protein